MSFTIIGSRSPINRHVHTLRCQPGKATDQVVGSGQSYRCLAQGDLRTPARMSQGLHQQPFGCQIRLPALPPECVRVCVCVRACACARAAYGYFLRVRGCF